MKDFRELKVWQMAHQLTLAVYQLTATFRHEELYGLTSQLRRSCSSIPANLAEGCGRNGDAEFARFCSIAMGSASEVEYHLLLARDLKLIPPKDYEAMAPRVTELKRMLTALFQKLTAESSRPQRFQASLAIVSERQQAGLPGTSRKVCARSSSPSSSVVFTSPVLAA